MNGGDNMKLICEKALVCPNQKCIHARSHKERCDCSKPDDCDYFKRIQCIRKIYTWDYPDKPIRVYLYTLEEKRPPKRDEWYTLLNDENETVYRAKIDSEVNECEILVSYEYRTLI
jgi:hypothetical protein